MKSIQKEADQKWKYALEEAHLRLGKSYERATEALAGLHEMSKFLGILPEFKQKMTSFWQNCPQSKTFWDQLVKVKVVTGKFG
jgi:hypothetical protein